MDGVPAGITLQPIGVVRSSVYVSGRVESLAEGVAVARAAIDEGRAAAVLDRFVEVTNQ